MNISMELVLSTFVSVISMVLTYWIFWSKTKNTIENGINDRLSSMEKVTEKLGTDICWIKDRLDHLWCVDHPEEYFQARQKK